MSSMMRSSKGSTSSCRIRRPPRSRKCFVGTAPTLCASTARRVLLAGTVTVSSRLYLTCAGAECVATDPALRSHLEILASVGNPYDDALCRSACARGGQLCMAVMEREHVAERSYKFTSVHTLTPHKRHTKGKKRLAGSACNC